MEILKSSKNNSQIHFARRILGRFICYIGVEDVRHFVKDIYIVFAKERSSELVEYHVETIKEKSIF